MKILFWVPYPQEGASNRYRVGQYLDYLRENEINYSLRPFWSSSAYKVLYQNGHYIKKSFSFLAGTLSRILDIILIFRYQAVFIHREAFPVGGAFFETIVFLFKKPIIFDFDDAIFLPAFSRQNNFIEKFKSPQKTARIIQLSNYVIAGNDYLAEYALKINNMVTVIPTSVDTQKYQPDKLKQPGGKIVIGWMGSVTTVDFLDEMKDPFKKLSEKYPDIIFKIVGGQFHIDGLPNVISKPWSLKEEIQDLLSFDIGIMPMPENRWTKGKCGFKSILYMSMGIPCVCSPVGMNKDIINEGENGFLAKNPQDWIDKLSLLIEDPVLRNKFGLAGRETVEQKYSVNINAPKFLEVLKAAVGQKRKILCLR